VMLHMHEQATDMIDFQRASGALPILIRPHHEVLDEELAPSVKKAGQSYIALDGCEDVLFLYLDPGKPSLPSAQIVLPLHDFLFSLEKGLPFPDPFLSGNDSMLAG